MWGWHQPGKGAASRSEAFRKSRVTVRQGGKDFQGDDAIEIPLARLVNDYPATPQHDRARGISRPGKSAEILHGRERKRGGAAAGQSLAEQAGGAGVRAGRLIGLGEPHEAQSGEHFQQS